MLRPTKIQQKPQRVHKRTWGLRRPCQSLIWLSLTLIATLLVEHSPLDIAISQLFYSHDATLQGHWLIQKGAQPYAFMFYYAPKYALMVLGLGLLLLLLKTRAKTKPHSWRVHTCLSLYQQPLGKRDLGYVLLTLILVPSLTATLKSLTHVSCPSHLLLFDGTLPYLTIWQNMVAQTPAKCFPAAHASAGFALYAFAFLPRLAPHCYKIFVAVTLIGWTMGLYKMLIGDHFLSHTLVSMLLAATLASGLAAMIFKEYKPR